MTLSSLNSHPQPNLMRNFCLSFAALFCETLAHAETPVMKPGAIWTDDHCEHIDTHGRIARVGAAVSDMVQGPYKYLRSFRPLGQENSDIGQFIDKDGSAYLIFESRPTKGLFIAKLSDDYLDVTEQTAFIGSLIEGGALVHHDEKALRPAKNRIEFKVANVWTNRLITDAGLPESECVSLATFNPYKPGDRLRSSGLLGPVQLRTPGNAA